LIHGVINHEATVRRYSAGQHRVVLPGGRVRQLHHRSRGCRCHPGCGRGYLNLRIPSGGLLLAVTLLEALAPEAERAGVSIDDAAGVQLEKYAALLRAWNRRISLTSLPIEGYGAAAIRRLFLEPLIAATHLPEGRLRVFDVGSGAGSPAIPLKIACPEMALTMVESKTRKAAFLREVVRQLDLREAAVECSRFEELVADPANTGIFDVVTMRAVRADEETWLAVDKFLKPGGLVLWFQAGEVVAATKLGGGRLQFRADYPLGEAYSSKLLLYEKQ